jgi:hypothetical protein
VRRDIKSAPDLRSVALLLLTVSKVAVDINRDHVFADNSNIPRALTHRGFVKNEKGAGLHWL